MERGAGSERLVEGKEARRGSKDHTEENELTDEVAVSELSLESVGGLVEICYVPEQKITAEINLLA
jgi:hypothetical protein